MKQIDKIVVSTTPPALTNVIWKNPETKEVLYFNNGKWIQFLEVSFEEIKKTIEDNIEATAEEIEDLTVAVEDALQSLDTKIDEKIAALVDSAPENLDTLNELAQALNKNKIADEVVKKLAELKEGKQDKYKSITTFSFMKPRIYEAMHNTMVKDVAFPDGSLSDNTYIVNCSDTDLKGGDIFVCKHYFFDIQALKYTISDAANKCCSEKGSVTPIKDLLSGKYTFEELNRGLPIPFPYKLFGVVESTEKGVLYSNIGKIYDPSQVTPQDAIGVNREPVQPNSTVSLVDSPVDGQNESPHTAENFNKLAIKYILELIGKQGTDDAEYQLVKALTFYSQDTTDDLINNIANGADYEIANLKASVAALEENSNSGVSIATYYYEYSYDLVGIFVHGMDFKRNLNESEIQQYDNSGSSDTKCLYMMYKTRIAYSGDKNTALKKGSLVLGVNSIIQLLEDYDNGRNDIAVKLIMSGPITVITERATYLSDFEALTSTTISKYTRVLLESSKHSGKGFCYFPIAIGQLSTGDTIIFKCTEDDSNIMYKAVVHEQRAGSTYIEKIHSIGEKKTPRLKNMVSSEVFAAVLKDNKWIKDNGSFNSSDFTPMCWDLLYKNHYALTDTNTNKTNGTYEIECCYVANNSAVCNSYIISVVGRGDSYYPSLSVRLKTEDDKPLTRGEFNSEKCVELTTSEINALFE